MRLLVIFFHLAGCWAGILSINVPAPHYQISDDRLIVEDAAFMNAPGIPDVPGKTVTIALPPGALVDRVEFRGSREEIGECSVPAAHAAVPVGGHGDIFKKINENFVRNREIYYASPGLFPDTYGRVLSEGGLRKYRLITLLCHHFAYRPAARKVYCSPVISVDIHYRMPEEHSERAAFWKGLRNDVTYDAAAADMIFNWDEARQWYKTDSPRRANGYYIIMPAVLESSVDSLVAYRRNQGYDVSVISTEYIEANVAGVDLTQKIRSYLRANMADIEYALLVGFLSDVPWRKMVPWNNDPDSPYNDPDISPIPSELYYAELTDPDSLSWNSDGDIYWGEVYDANGQPNGDDDPDYHADIHVGRIPFSTPSIIADICAKMIAFDRNTDVEYKAASLLAAAMYYYENENNGGSFRLDGASFTEELLNDRILDSTKAVRLYEKAGLRPSIYPCTDSITRENQIRYWMNKGIMYECHHGNYNCYARKIWAWDDGDSIPENNEISWPLSLHINDVNGLDNSRPATSFLRSCLCGKPEVYGLGAYLLWRGSSAVISSSRIAWLSLADLGGIPHHFFERLMQDTTITHGVIGAAFDAARIDFMATAGHWVIAYHYNLFGDPALRQLGRLTGIDEQKEVTVGNSRTPHSCRTIFAGSYWTGESGRRKVYDVTGRSVLPDRMKPGIYFIEVDGKVTHKVVKVR